LLDEARQLVRTWPRTRVATSRPGITVGKDELLTVEPSPAERGIDLVRVVTGNTGWHSWEHRDCGPSHQPLTAIAFAARLLKGPRRPCVPGDPAPGPSPDRHPAQTPGHGRTAAVGRTRPPGEPHSQRACASDRGVVRQRGTGLAAHRHRARSTTTVPCALPCPCSSSTSAPMHLGAASWPWKRLPLPRHSRAGATPLRSPCPPVSPDKPSSTCCPWRVRTPLWSRGR
jgi:hypothetical protein